MVTMPPETRSPAEPPACAPSQRSNQSNCPENDSWQLLSPLLRSLRYLALFSPRLSHYQSFFGQLSPRLVKLAAR